MLDVVTSLLAGLGIFFSGVKIISNNLKQMTSRRIRLLVSQWADNGWLAGLLGVVLVLVTQSGSAMTFIIVSLISSGLLTVRKALPMLIWANGGGAFVVLIVMLDIRLLVLLLLGIAGVSYYLDRPVKYRSAVAVLFGLGLLFFGLQWIRTSAAPLAELAWFTSVLYHIKDSYILALAVGALLSFVVQSSPAVSVAAIAMTQAGLLTIDQTILIIYGTHLGSSATIWFLSTGLKGTSKQLAMAQVLFNVTACAVFVPLFYLEVYAHIPLVKSLVTATGHGIEKQMSYVFISFNFFTAVALSFCMEPLHTLLVRFWPPTAEEDKSKVKFIHDQAVHDPETAMDLAEKEQLRLLQLLPEYMVAVRTARAVKQPLDCNATHQAFAALAPEVHAFLNDLFQNNLAHKTAERLLNILNRHSLLVSLEENVYQLAQMLAQTQASDALGSLGQSFTEGLDTILLTAVEAMEASELAEVSLLLSLTEDRGSLMEQIRGTYLANEQTLAPQDKSTLLYVTNLFERIVWMIGRLGILLRSGAQLLMR